MPSTTPPLRRVFAALPCLRSMRARHARRGLPRRHSLPALRALAALLLVGATAGAAAAGEPVLTLTPAQVAAIGVRTQRLAADAAQPGARHPGTVVVPPGQQRVLAAPLPALVESLRVSVGDSVRAGQVLAVLRSAQAQELQHDVHVSRSQAGLAASTLARDEQLYKEGLIPLARLEASRVQAELAAEHREEREKMLAQVGSSVNGPSGVLTLVAPIAGVVLERQVVVGQRVDAAAPLLRIARLAPLWVEMQVPARTVAAVRVGSAVTLAGHAARGRVLAVAPTVDAATQSVMVRAEFSGSLDGLRAGQAVEAQIDEAPSGSGSGDGNGAARLPASAVLQGSASGPDSAMVFVEIAPGQYRATPVKRAGASGATATVLGLPAGSTVVVQGTAALKALLTGAQR